MAVGLSMCIYLNRGAWAHPAPFSCASLRCLQGARCAWCSEVGFGQGPAAVCRVDGAAWLSQLENPS